MKDVFAFEELCKNAALCKTTGLSCFSATLVYFKPGILSLTCKYIYGSPSVTSEYSNLARLCHSVTTYIVASFYPHFTLNSEFTKASS